MKGKKKKTRSKTFLKYGSNELLNTLTIRNTRPNVTHVPEAYTRVLNRTH